MANDNPATDDKQSFIARFSTGFLAFFGATSAADFGAKFQEKFLSIFTRLEAVEKREVPAAFDVKPFEARIAAMEASLKDAPTKVNVESWAKSAGESAGSAKAIEAVAAVGLNPGTVVAASPTNAPTQTDNTVATLIKNGQFVEAFAALPADHKDRKDFASADRYAAYMRAVSGGSVAVFKGEK